MAPAIDVEAPVADVAAELGLTEQVTVVPHAGVPRVWADIVGSPLHGALAGGGTVCGLASGSRPAMDAP